MQAQARKEPADDPAAGERGAVMARGARRESERPRVGKCSSKWTCVVYGGVKTEPGIVRAVGNTLAPSRELDLDVDLFMSLFIFPISMWGN
jgi:hypothetical protein